MSFDYNCQTVIEQNKLLERLGEIEATLEEIKDSRKKEEIQDERKEIFEVLCDKHFSPFYQYIKGLESLNEDADIRPRSMIPMPLGGTGLNLTVPSYPVLTLNRNSWNFSKT